MINLRQEMDRILENYGHHVLLQRTSRRIRCICWDEKHQESSVDLYLQRINRPDLYHKVTACPRCIGKGWVSRIERHKVRRDNASQIISLPNLIKQMNVGQVSSDARVFFMRHDTHPKKGDFIYEVGWQGHKPTHMIRAYEISTFEDFRGQGGRIEYYVAVTKETNVETDIRQFVIRRLGPVKNYEPIY